MKVVALFLDIVPITDAKEPADFGVYQVYKGPIHETNGQFCAKHLEVVQDRSSSRSSNVRNVRKKKKFHRKAGTEGPRFHMEYKQFMQLLGCELNC